jgi:hypothetical protein
MSDLLSSTWLFAGVLGVVVVLVAAIRAVLRKRELLHRERMAAIEKRFEVPRDVLSDVPSPEACLLRGLIWLFAGIGVSVFFVAMGVSQGDSELFGVATAGLVPVGIGSAYLIMYRRSRARPSGQG